LLADQSIVAKVMMLFDQHIADRRADTTSG
jgi:hypothetical protein